MHGLSIPVGKLGFYLPRTISNALDSSSRDEPEPFHIGEHLHNEAQHIRQRQRHNQQQFGRRTADNSPPRPVFRIGRSVIGERASQAGTPHVVSPRAASPAQSASPPNDIPLNNLDRPQPNQENGAAVPDANGSIIERTLANGAVDKSSS